MAKPYVNGHKRKPLPKKLLTMYAEAEFFNRLDTLCEAETPPVSRAYMIRKLVFESKVKHLNGHHGSQVHPAGTRKPSLRDTEAL